MDTNFAGKMNIQTSEDVSSSASLLGMADDEVKINNLPERLRFLELNERSATVMRDSKKVLMAAMPGILESFYAKLAAEPLVARFFSSAEKARSAKNRQRDHWERVTDAGFDNNYLQAAVKIGKIHEQIGLEPSWYIASYGLIMDGLAGALINANWPKKAFGKEAKGKQALSDKVGILIRSALLDMELTISAYLSVIDSQVKKRDEHHRLTMDSAITAMNGAVDKLARGDLTCHLGEEFPQEYAALRTNFNLALEKLTETIVKLHGNADNVDSSIRELSAASEDMSRRTEGQAASLEQSTSALTDLADAVRQTSVGIAQVSEAVKAANAGARDVGSVVSEAGGAMQQINDSSRKIGNIIGLIDEIAFQTNLLALNAGVEAARAGEAGRGFAVVATEVRALAQRSADAAKEIKTLISLSSQQVARGVELVQRSGDALTGITGNIVEINELASNISENSRSQSAGLGQVSEAMSSMSVEVQKNAAMAEQTTASVHSLSSEINSLSASLNAFKL